MLGVGGDELLLSGGALLTVTASVLLPVAIAGAAFLEQRKGREQEAGPGGAGACPAGARRPSAGRVADAAPAGAPKGEPRGPELELRDWRHAGQLPGCPWSFDGCEDVQDALERIWRRPLARDLRPAFEALRASVQGVRVARAVPAAGAVHFAAVYSLRGGATLFGGAPLEHAVGVELGDCPPGRCASPPSGPRGGSRSPRRGLRRRLGDSPGGPASEAPELPLPCLAPFYRVHDGFGVLLATAHLPRLLQEPAEALGGSCFYVYPARGLSDAAPASGLVAFARVDHRCVACADGDAEWPGVVYVESGERVEEEDEEEELEAPLAFAAETVRNVVGRDRALLGGAGHTDTPTPFAG